jgi:hypothetical protein
LEAEMSEVCEKCRDCGAKLHPPEPNAIEDFGEDCTEQFWFCDADSCGSYFNDSGEKQGAMPVPLSMRCSSCRDLRARVTTLESRLKECKVQLGIALNAEGAPVDRVTNVVKSLGNCDRCGEDVPQFCMACVDKALAKWAVVGVKIEAVITALESAREADREADR